jgi:hypothetical protein
MEEEFELGGQTAVESDPLTFADLAKHCKKTRYCEVQFDSEGRKIVGVRGKSTVDSHIKERIVKLECKSGKKTTVRPFSSGGLFAIRESRM